MPQQTNRRDDHRAEQIVGQYLDINLYSYLSKMSGCSIHRVTDRESQLAGIDLIMDKGNLFFNIDEKSQIYYINRPLNTFAIELCFKTNNHFVSGWFLNESNKTDFYLFVWIPKARTSDVKILCLEDIYEIEVAFVKKADIVNYLIHNGIDKEFLYNTLNKMRIEDIQKLSCNSDYWFRYSNQLKEQPVNLILKKTLINRLAINRYLVHPGDVTILK